jgi:photosystem II stability/assembly factor-like uncharacterized protein
MKKFTILILFLGLARMGFSQFVAMPLNYPWDNSLYLSYWTSIIDDNVVWVGTAKQKNYGYVAYSNAVRTTDGGNTWQFFTIPVPGNPWIQHLAAWDVNTCYYLFTDGTTHGGAVWKTTDGGSSWSKKTTSQFNGGWGDVIHCFSADTVLVMGDPTGGYFEIQLTFDGGNSWTRVPASDIPASLTGETGTSSEYCAVGNTIWFPTSKGRCFKSSDRGLHWTVTQVTSGYISLCFSDTLNGFAYVPATTDFYRTLDGGLTWTHEPAAANQFGNMCRVPGLYGGYVFSTSDTSNFDVFFTPDFYNTVIQLDSNLKNGSYLNFKNATTGWLGGGGWYIQDIHKFTGVLTSVVEKSKHDENIQIIPNPTSREALVKIPRKCISGETMIRIMDISGKTVSEVNIDGSSGWCKLNASSYKNGFYIVELVSKNGNISTQRWIVQH